MGVTSDIWEPFGEEEAVHILAKWFIYVKLPAVPATINLPATAQGNAVRRLRRNRDEML
jgi:hypothetical protein